MRELRIKQVSEYLPVIRECFATDQELICRWHVCAPADIDTCVDRTFNDLKNAPTIKMFVIVCVNDGRDDIVGFFGHETAMGMNWLTSFFIKPEYRKKQIFDFFWKSVYEVTGNEFFTAIYSHNKRAQKFLEKNGFTLVQITEIKENKNALIFQN